MMTNSEFFAAAHKTARETRDSFSSYRAAFSAALKAQYAAEKASKKSIEEKILEAGGKEWRDRIYLNDAIRVLLSLEAHTDGKWYAKGTETLIFTSREYKEAAACVYYDTTKKCFAGMKNVSIFNEIA